MVTSRTGGYVPGKLTESPDLASLWPPGSSGVGKVLPILINVTGLSSQSYVPYLVTL